MEALSSTVEDFFFVFFIGIDKIGNGGATRELAILETSDASSSLSCGEWLLLVFRLTRLFLDSPRADQYELLLLTVPSLGIPEFRTCRCGGRRNFRLLGFPPSDVLRNILGKRSDDSS